MIVGQEHIVLIEKMLNEGNSLARISNFPVFILGGCPEDKVKIKLTQVKKNYALAQITEIIQPSKYRVKPICALHNVCGSCDWQHIAYDEQLKQKHLIVTETLKRIADNNVEVLPTIPSPTTSEYRCKIQLPVSQTKVSKRILTGYYKKGSHELVNIKYCPMQPNIINEISEFIKEEALKFDISAYNEKINKGLLRHIIFRISSDLTNILIIFVINADKIPNVLNQLSSIVMEKYPIVKGVCANINTQNTNVILGKNTLKILGNDFYIESLNNYKFQVSANSFFQVNPFCASLIFDKVKKLITDKLDKPTILDAYSGVSSFGIWLASIASQVTCIEEVKSASIDAEENKKLNNINNVEIINGDAAIQFKKLIDNGVKFDISVTDPPRKGCSDESINNLVNLTKKYIIYVSCNVATLARDMKILNEKGFKTIFIQPVDMFPNTYHVETIAMFEKE